MISSYFIHIGILIGMYIIIAVSLNLALGYTGLLNLGHVAFFGIGAYTSALLTKQGVPFLAAFLCAGLVASLFGLILVWATRKLKGDYLALATLGFSYVIYSLMINLTEITRGPLGIPGISKPVIFGFMLKSNLVYLVFVAAVAIVTVLVIKRIITSPFGRLLQATRDDELGLNVLGKDTRKLKMKAMMISAFFAGISGSLFAHYIGYIEPGSFLLTELIVMLTIVIVGGLASIKGSIAASFIIIILPEFIRFLSLPSSIVGPARQIVYALILIGILLVRPRGIFGKVDLQ
ncbi:MAG TPA: branched-chain amino acid ABC transporter permease [Candidatus Nanoarchaeia archaeon]|nr:branched-chain amino acid ABC transporter permease [Candidatus Nanoarchaeia archaeon]